MSSSSVWCSPSEPASRRRVLGALLPFARRHRGPLALGASITAVGVAAQLALPWPLRALLQHWTAAPQAEPAGFWAGLPGGLEPAWVLTGAFALLVVVAGYCDHAQRLWFARFAIAWSRDVRAAAFGAAMNLPLRERRAASGDLVARLLADVARFKAGVKVSLTYVGTNVLLLGLASALAAWHSPALALVFAGALAAALVAAAVGSRRVEEAYLAHRDFEGALAGGAVQAGLTDAEDRAFQDANASSGRREAAEIGLQGSYTWIAHAIAGLAVLAAVLVGGGAVARGTLDPTVLLVFLAYALLFTKPLVRLTRHGARTGKLVATGRRLQALLERGGRAERTLPALAEALRVEGLVLPGAAPGAPPGQLEIRVGERVALLGAPGSGRSALLKLLAARPGAGGRVLWDGRALDDFTASALEHRIGYLPADPRWSARGAGCLREYLGLPSGPLAPGAARLLGGLGLGRYGLEGGAELDPPRAASTLACSERRLLALARLLLRPPGLLLLDEPTAGLDRESGRAEFEALGWLPSTTAVVFATSRPSDVPGAMRAGVRALELAGGAVVRDGALIVPPAPPPRASASTRAGARAGLAAEGGPA